MAEPVEDGVPDMPEEASREEPEEEYPVEVKRQVRVLDPEPEPEPQAPAATATTAKATAMATAKPPGRPNKDPGAPKAKYSPRKPAAPKAVAKAVAMAAPPRSEPVDEEAVARYVVNHLGSAARSNFEARREGWRDLIAANYHLQ